MLQRSKLVASYIAEVHYAKQVAEGSKQVARYVGER